MRDTIMQWVKGVRALFKKDDSGELYRIPHLNSIRPIDLSSKEAYLLWVAEWKGYWKTTVEGIQRHKKDYYYWRKTARLEKDNLRKDFYYSRMWDAAMHRDRLKNQSRELHALRMEGKKRSWEAREKALTIEV